MKIETKNMTKEQYIELGRQSELQKIATTYEKYKNEFPGLQNKVTHMEIFGYEVLPQYDGHGLKIRLSTLKDFYTPAQLGLLLQKHENFLKSKGADKAVVA